MLAFLDHFGLDPASDRINPYGGAIALGHPLASSGVRLMIHLARQFREHPEIRYGITTMCIGLGMGGTVIWENPHHSDARRPREQASEHRRPRPLMPEDELQALLAEASELTPDERVTRFLSRDMVLPHTGRTAVLITLDNGEDHTKPNTLGPRSLDARTTTRSNAALARDDVAAIAITGKPFILAAGADLKALGGLTGRDQAVTIAQIGHAVFDKLHTSPVPTFAFINGLALGGGLEISLHAHYRTVSRAAAGIALPECFLGLLPGWGGTYLLPNLIGPDNAVTVIIENALSQNKMLGGPQVASSASPTRCSTAPTSWPSRSTGPVGSWPARSRSIVRRSTGARAGTRRSRGASSSPTPRPPVRPRRRTGPSS